MTSRSTLARGLHRHSVTRPWIPWLMALAAGSGICWFQFWNQDGAIAFLGSVSMGGAFVVGMCIRYALGSTRPARHRYLPLATVLVAMALGAALFRVDSVTGNMIPRLAFRFSPRFDQRLAREGLPARASEVVVDLATTTVEDYPRFLGADGRAHVEGLQLGTDWEADPPRRLWRQPIGAGWSSFAIVHGFAVTQEQRGEHELVTCYELRTGKTCWTHARAVRFQSDFGGVGPLSTPTIAKGKVYALGATGLLTCLEGRDGSVVWERDILADNDSLNVKWGKSCSPLVVEEMVIVSAGGPEGKSLVAYNASTGKVIWRGGNHISSYASPLLAHFESVPQIVMVNQEFVTSHDLETGRVLWEHPWPGFSNSNATASQPVPLDSSRMFISKGYGVGAALWEIRREGGQFSVREIWRTRLMKTKFTNVVVHRGYVYGLDEGVLCCLDLAAGQKQWKEGRYGHGQVLLVGDVILVQSEQGHIALVDASPTAFRELARFQAVEGKTWATPAMAGNVLVVRSENEAAAYELPLKDSKVLAGGP